jgi:hypothetical protein
LRSCPRGSEYIFGIERAIHRLIFREAIKGWKRILVRLMRINGASVGVTGPVTIEAYAKGELVDRHEQEGLWEVMYYGDARAPKTDDPAELT